ncbi:hypothetical protein GTA08_BOTSDO02685 [Botryosphaeria dothidea]|uniref:Rhodopsin domain-containing protein n=1 Tax=Botryosphaeria dothidea TaxID=55169 RepID=A0A8H4N7U5_9PEZI|nr:hypothetical protein GTA08_BOTSDO02685 [Botryosphaeria dothidea]
MRASKKFAVIGIFLLGAVSVGASIGRIISLHKLATMRDQSWGIASGIYWTCVEPCVGIISACLPTLGPLIRRWGGKLSSHFTNSYDNATGDRRPVPHSGPQQVPGLNPSYSDEYELRNAITGTGRKTNSVRTSEDLEMAGIIVTQEISFTRK